MCFIHLPPNLSTIKYESHCQSIEDVSLKYPDHSVIVAGDYNLPDAKWCFNVNGVVVDCPAFSIVIPNGHNNFLHLILDHNSDIHINNAVNLLMHNI